MQNIILKHKTILITGAAGFIGANLTLALLRCVEGVRIIGIDNMNDYYDVSLKEYRLAKIREFLGASGDAGREPGVGSGEVPDKGSGADSAEVPGRGSGVGSGEVPDKGPGVGSGEVPDRGSGVGSGEVPGRGSGVGSGEVPDRGSGVGSGEVPDKGSGVGSGETPDAVSGSFQFVKADISDKAVVQVLFQIYRPDVVVNLAAQAGVRYSITNPDAYIEANLVGFYNILEACRHSCDGGGHRGGKGGAGQPQGIAGSG